MKVLIACEYSGTLLKELRENGQEAFSCDLRKYEGEKEYEEYFIRGNVIPLMKEKWDFIIAHPPCKYLCASNALMYKEELGKDYVKWRKEEQKKARDFFMQLYERIDYGVIENSRPMKGLLPYYDQVVDPTEYGSEYNKRTCLWYKGNVPHLQPKYPYKVSKSLVYSHSSDKLRAKLDPYLAKAMVESWFGNTGYLQYRLLF